VVEPAQGRPAPGYDVVGSAARNVDDEGDATRVMLVLRMVKPLWYR
jgi:hypothetical protein